MNDQHSSDQHRPHDDDGGGAGGTGEPVPAPAVPSAPSVLDSVVVHAAGAVCRRRARAALPPGGRLRLTGLPDGLDPRSLRARVLAGPAGTAVTEARLEVVAELREPSELPELRRSLDAAEEHGEALREQHRLVLAAIAETSALRAVPPPRHRDEPLRRTPADAWLELAEFVDERLTGLHERAGRLAQEIELADHEFQVLADRLARLSSAERHESVGTTTTALLTLTTPGPQGSPSGPDPETSPDPQAGPDPETRQAPETLLDLELEYTVQAARWVPSYRLAYRQGADTGHLLLRASVAQQTGEDWTGVRLALSTADLDRRTDLPKLRSLRIGRSQPAPPPSGWREPPPGLAGLFTGYDAAGPRPVPHHPHHPRRAAGGPGGTGVALAAAEPRLSAPVSPVVPTPAPLPPPSAAPTPQPPGGLARARARTGGLRSADEAGGPGGPGGPGGSGTPAEPGAVLGYGAPPPAPGSPAPGAAFAKTELARFAAPAPFTPPPGPPVPDGTLLDYPALELSGPDAPADRRGTLHHPDRPHHSDHPHHPDRPHHFGHPAPGLTRLPLPHHAVPPRVSAGSFDHRFDAVAPADLPSDATWHTVTIGEIPVSVSPEYVTVPAVEERVYATLVITNATAQAVLAGPVEVTVDEEFLLTAALPTLAPGGVRRLGIGVAESVEVTRRTELRESTAGMLNSSTVLDHRVHVELANRLGRPVTVEVRERVPVSSDADIRIEERPGWHAPDEPSTECPPSTRLRRVELPPGGRAELDGGYQIRIPAGKAIVGGNRRN
ncbi:DUF4139 domain-containing protein [Kitasatospora sp. NPDC058115]|uniref:DUF4139 domain-containing protein n=1 Tax=Kitasatospora sp. NPDC058115 TaxID=3346347 RepID=UPI0036D7A239